MFKIVFFIGFFIFGWMHTLAQESSQYTIYMGQKYALNPAYAGLESTLSITGAVRSQWQELPGAPNSKIIMAQLPLYYLNGAGGIKIEQENFGAEKTVRGLVSYNYVYESNIGLFSAGLGVGFIQKSLDGSVLKTPQGKYEGGLVLHNDPVLAETQLTGISPQLSAGIYFAQDQLEMGLSFENFQSPSVHFNRSDAVYNVKPRANFYAEYRLDINNFISFTPSVLVKSNLIKYQIDLTGMATINAKVFAGLGVRGYSGTTFDAITLIGGLKISENLKVFYGTDFTLSSLRTTQQGTHELMINYNLNKAIGGIEREPIIYNPRY